MKVFVSKDGQQYGPYASDQLREYVQQGNFTINDLACHDGQNWVTIGQVPGFAEATQPAAMQAPSAPQQEQTVHEPMSIIFNILVGLGVIATAGGVWGLLPWAGTAIILGFALSAAGISCSASYEKQGGVLGMMLMLVGTITAAVEIIDKTGKHVIGFLIVPVLFLVVSVLGKSGTLAALAALAIFPTISAMVTEDALAFDFKGALFPTVTIILFAALSLGAYHLSKVFASDYKRLAIIFSRTSLLVVNVGFWIGSVGDRGPTENVDSVSDHAHLVFVIAWAVALVGTGVWAAKNDKRWVVNLSAVFGIIHVFTQLLPHDILDWENGGYLIAPVLFLVVSVLAKSGWLAALAALAIFPATLFMVSNDKYIPTVTIILFAALSLGAYHWSKALASDYKRLAIIFSRTSLLVVNLGFWIGSFSDHDPLVFVIAWAVALVGTGVWAAKNDKRWVVNLSAVFGIIAIFSQLFSFEFHPLSILIVGLTSLGLAFAMVRYNKHATSPADPKTARTPAKSYESMPARVKTAEVPGFADAGDSVTMPQQDQVVQEKAVEQQPASANASNSPAKKKKIILWACIGGGATLLVVGLLIWLLGDDEAVQDAQEKKAEASPQSNQSPASPPDAKIAQVGKIDLDDPKTRKKIIANAVKHPSKMNQLQSRGKKGEELLYRKNQPKPYTGWSKWMGGNGRIRNLIQRKDGKLNGLVVWFYKKNGQKEWRATYKDGQKHGLQTLWYENGQKKGERTYKDGKQHGLQTWWYENRQKKEEVTYGDGKLITAVGWKPNGEKCPDTNVKDGNGVWVYYNEDGTEKRRDTYKYGVLVKD
jgi:antitoxin component YwqK of YwqJK toxin-antitoxin module